MFLNVDYIKFLRLLKVTVCSSCFVLDVREGRVQGLAASVGDFHLDVTLVPVVRRRCEGKRLLSCYLSSLDLQRMTGGGGDAPYPGHMKTVATELATSVRPLDRHLVIDEKSKKQEIPETVLRPLRKNLIDGRPGGMIYRRDPDPVQNVQGIPAEEALDIDHKMKKDPYLSHPAEKLSKAVLQHDHRPTGGMIHLVVCHQSEARGHRPVQSLRGVTIGLPLSHPLNHKTVLPGVILLPTVSCYH